METAKNTKAQGRSEFVIQNPPRAVLDRMRAAGLTWTDAPSRNGYARITVSIPNEVTIEPIYEEPTIP